MSRQKGQDGTALHLEMPVNVTRVTDDEYYDGNDVLTLTNAGTRDPHYL